MEEKGTDEMERVVLGMMLTNTDCLNRGASELVGADFVQPEHVYIFKALMSIYKQDVAATQKLLVEELKSFDKLESAGGVAYTKIIEEYRECSKSFDGAMTLVKARSIKRRLSQESLSIYKKSLEENEDAVDLLEEAQARLFAIGNGVTKNTMVTIKELIEGARSVPKKNVMKEIQERQEAYRKNGEQANLPDVVKTHFYDLDNVIHGLGNRHLILLAARTSIGKTAFAINIAENTAIKGGIPVGIFSLEMGAGQLLFRLLCSNAQISSDKIKKGNLTGEEFQELNVAADRLSKASIIIDDETSLKISDLTNRARRMKEAYGIGLLIIDYLQLIKGSGSYRSEENRQTEVAEVSRSLKALAGELNIPILCLAQLSRKVEERENKKPILSDLRESGSLEQDADVVILLTRKEKYNPDDKAGLAQLNIAKNRHGRTEEIEIGFKSEYGQFFNYQKPEKVSSAYQELMGR